MAQRKKPLLEQLTGTVGAVAGLITAVAALIVAWTQWGGSGDGGSADAVVATNEAVSNGVADDPAPAVPQPGPGADRDEAAPVSGPTLDRPCRAMLDNPQMALIIVRAEPSSTSAQVGEIHPNEVVYAGAEADGWRPLRTRSGVTGWTRAGNLRVVCD